MAFKKKYTSTSTLHHKIQQQLGVCLWAEEVVEVGGDCVVAYEKWNKENKRKKKWMNKEKMLN